MWLELCYVVIWIFRYSWKLHTTLELPLNTLHQQQVMSAFLSTPLPHNKSALPVMGSGMRKSFSGMQLAAHQQDSPCNFRLWKFMGVSHCALKTSGKITIEHQDGSSTLLVGAHAVDLICLAAYAGFPYPGHYWVLGFNREKVAEMKYL